MKRHTFVLSLGLVACLLGCADDSAPAAGAGSAVPLLEESPLRFERETPALGRTRPPDTLRLARSFGGSEDFSGITDVALVGQNLVVIDRFMSPHLAVVDLPSGSISRRLGRDGEGPGEFRVPVPAAYRGEEPGHLWIYDFSNRRMTLMDIRKPGRDAVRKEFRLGAKASILIPVWMGSHLVANGLYGDFTLLVMDDGGWPVARVGAAPPFRPELTRIPGARQANRGFIAADPRGERMALAYQFASRVDFFGPEGARYGTVQGPRAVTARYHIDGTGRFRWKDDNEMAHWGMAATQRYVYTLFCGCKLLTGNESPALLHVYDWEGRFVAELALDRPIRSLAVSPDDAILYGGYEEPYPAVGEWRLPASLRERSAR